MKAMTEPRGIAASGDLVRRAETKLQRGDLSGAYDDCRQALALSRQNGRAHYLLSRIATAKGAHADALTLCDVALAIDGETPEYLGRRAACLMQTGRRGEAYACAVSLLARGDLPGPVLESISFVFHAVADFSRVLEAQQRLLLLKPDDPVILANLGASHFLCGHTEEAHRALQKAIALDPRNVQAYGSLCSLVTATPDENHIAALKALIAAENDLYARVKLQYALASQYFDLDRPEDGFAALKEGKDAVIAASGYDVQRDLDMFAALHRLIDAAPPLPPSAPAGGPIFVVGMPRSGTTVVERMLTNCEGVASIGESIAFVDLVRRASGSPSPRFADASTIAACWPHLPLPEIGKAYIGFGNARAAGAERFVDKLPLNLLFVPLIVRALPGARIVCLQRDPLDTILGNYRRLLEFHSGTFHYTTSLQATAVYVAENRKLAARLVQHYPKHFRLQSYEALVAEPVAQGREIADFCGLTWHNEAAKIENNLTPGGSASAAQVRAPIHARYIGRWKPYRAFLGEAMGVLERYGVPWDDDPAER